MITEKEFRAAWAVCQAARNTWLVSDPLGNADFDTLGTLADLRSWSRDALEAVVISKPKQSGGLRYESFLDPVSSSMFQVLAERIMQSCEMPAHSASARLFGVSMRGADSYDLWNAAIPAWIRRQLG